MTVRPAARNRLCAGRLPGPGSRVAGPAAGAAVAGDRIRLTGIRAWAYHGVLAHERELGQAFTADVVLTVDLHAAGASDALADTVDYAAVASGVHDRLVAPRRDLVEALAADIARVVLDHDERIAAVEVTVRKPDAPVPVPVDEVAVTVRRERGDG